MSQKFKIKFFKTIFLIGAVVIVWCIHITFFSAPSIFPVGQNFTVQENESLKSLSNRLETEHYISSALLFRTWVSFIGRDRHIQLGEYEFDKPYSLGDVVKKMVSGKPDIPLVSVTIPEGSTVDEIASLIKKELPNFSIETFKSKVSSKNADGELFPSTYFLLPSTTEDRIVNIMTSTFEKKYRDAFPNEKIVSPLKNRTDVLSLAAILEGEAKTPKDMQIVAGILIKRLKSGMALQVDVAPATYKVKGLPIVPINNPGIVAMEAVFHPVSTDYLFYLTGKDGTMHYSKTFAEHKINIKKYL